jgi:putative endopeptidase
MIGQRRGKILGFATALALCASTTAGAGASARSQDPGNLDVSTPKYGAWGYDETGEETATAPGKDFFRFANGGWYDREQIPPDLSRYGNLNKLGILSENRSHLLIEDALAGRSSDPDAGKVADAYRAFMDEARIERLGARPLAPGLAAIKSEATRADIARTMGHAAGGFQSSLFGVGIGADAKAPTRYAVQMGTAGLGLPDRDYYLTPAFADKKAAYQAYVATLLGLIGWTDPGTSAKAVVDFETEIAQASWTRAERRDRDKTYNPMSVAELSAYAPGFDYQALLSAAQLGSVTRVIVSTNTAFPKIAAIYAKTPIETLKAWQAFHLADNAALYLSDPFVQARFEFRSKTLAGQPAIRPRWKRGGDFVNEVLGEAVGRMYVAKYFTPEAKAKIDSLVGNIKTALAARIEKVAWMSPETKARAEAKLAKFTVKIGYPAIWRDYSALKITALDLYGDAERSEAYEWAREVKRLNDPVDKLEWGMTPQTVNAYYNYANNEIVFPAAILQPPFFDPDADPAINYGGIGGVIGHEMTHGFDDQGRKSDGDGLLEDWWTAEDAAKFKIQADRLGAQYSQFEPVPGVHLKGELTMGENIADLGGVLLALDAYHASLHGQPAPVIDGLTGDQRVFLGWAQGWREKTRDEAARQRAVSDPHSPAHFRVNGPLRNIDAWYQAFDIKPTDPMYLPPDQRVRLW